MIRCLRLYLSAQTPPHKETITCGSVVHRANSVTQYPEEVSSVMCQMIENPTTEEPNSDRFWLTRNRTTFFENRGISRAATFASMMRRPSFLLFPARNEEDTNKKIDRDTCPLSIPIATKVTPILSWESDQAARMCLRRMRLNIGIFR